MVTCSACGSKNAAEAKFCSECGARLAPASRPIEERKVVTIVFCDLVGSTARAEQLDPEDVRAELSAYHARVRSELERHGGTVEKFIGDAVVAVFGAPLVHEDDAERAVRSALAIRDWALEEDAVDVRLAVNTGEALVSIDARADAGEGLVAGDVINTAARLQTAAPVNGILVGEKTYRATEGPIEYRERESVAAKGKQEPIAVWEAVSARSLFGVDVDFTGRDRCSYVIANVRQICPKVEGFDLATDIQFLMRASDRSYSSTGLSKLIAHVIVFSVRRLQMQHRCNNLKAIVDAVVGLSH